MREMAQERSGRARFHRKVQLTQLCVSTGHDAIALPILQELAAEIERRKLEDWETPDAIAQPLALLYRCLAQSRRHRGGTAEAVFVDLPAGSAPGHEHREIAYGAMGAGKNSYAIGAGAADRPRADGQLRSRLLRRSQSVRLLKASLRRDLEWLLNTRRTPEAVGREFQELEQSLYNYGVPDLTAINRESVARPESPGPDHRTDAEHVSSRA